MRSHVAAALSALALGVAFVAGCTQTPAPEGIKPRYGYPVEVVTNTNGRDEVWSTFDGTQGLYSFDLGPVKESVSRMTFVLKGQKSLEALTFTPQGGQPATFYESKGASQEGINVSRQGDDYVIAFDGKGLEPLRKGGRMQVIDYWR